MSRLSANKFGPAGHQQVVRVRQTLVSESGLEPLTFSTSKRRSSQLSYTEVETAGFEPTASSLSGTRSGQLSYASIRATEGNRTLEIQLGRLAPCQHEYPLHRFYSVLPGGNQVVASGFHPVDRVGLADKYALANKQSALHC